MIFTKNSGLLFYRYFQFLCAPICKKPKITITNKIIRLCLSKCCYYYSVIIGLEHIPKHSRVVWTWTYVLFSCLETVETRKSSVGTRGVFTPIYTYINYSSELGILSCETVRIGRTILAGLMCMRVPSIRI